MIENIGISGLVLLLAIFIAIRFFNTRGVLSRKAALAKDIVRFGNTPCAIIDAAWTGSDYTGLDAKLKNWNARIRSLAHLHNASPTLHETPCGLPFAISVLDDALSILKRGAPSDKRPSGTVLRQLRGGINDMLDTLESIGVAPTNEIPARPVLPDRIKNYLNRVGFESQGEFMLRRSLLLAWVKYGGHTWYDDQPTYWIGDPKRGSDG